MGKIVSRRPRLTGNNVRRPALKQHRRRQVKTLHYSNRDDPQGSPDVELFCGSSDLVTGDGPCQVRMVLVVCARTLHRTLAVPLRGGGARQRADERLGKHPSARGPGGFFKLAGPSRQRY